MARIKRKKRSDNGNRVCLETFDKCSFLFKIKEGEDFNHRCSVVNALGVNTWSILRIKIFA
jgi:hypothetical protein